MTEIAERTPMNAIVSRIRDDKFKLEIKDALPSSVTPDRFVRAAVTALMQNPELATADQASLLQSIIRCAQDGLLPDGREAALVIFNAKVKEGNEERWIKKVQYMSMIGGLRKIAADYGWTLRTRVVYANDEFEHEEGLAPKLVHKPARQGTERGALYAAYAIASKPGQEPIMKVLYRDDVERRKNASKSKNNGPWTQHEPAMWEKSAGRDAFDEIPMSESDRERADKMMSAADEYDDPVAALYGSTAPAIADIPFDEETGEVLEGEYEVADEAVTAALAIKVPGKGPYGGKTLQEVIDARPETDDVFRKMLAHDWKANPFGDDLLCVVRAYAPELLGEGEAA